MGKLSALPTSILVSELLELMFPTDLVPCPTSILVGERLGLMFPTDLMPCLLRYWFGERFRSGVPTDLMPCLLQYWFFGLAFPTDFELPTSILVGKRFQSCVPY